MPIANSVLSSHAGLLPLPKIKVTANSAVRYTDLSRGLIFPFDSPAGICFVLKIWKTFVVVVGIGAVVLDPVHEAHLDVGGARAGDEEELPEVLGGGLQRRRRPRRSKGDGLHEARF